MDIVAKQWKQQLQYLLEGRYYESLIFTSAEDIPILPFYTAENVKSPYVINTKTQVAVPLFISDKEATLKRIAFWKEQLVSFFLLDIHPKFTQKEVEEWLPANLQYLFTNSFAIDTTIYQKAGASMVQQIAFGVAQIKENPQTDVLNVKIAVGGTFLLEIAKLRAFRRLLNEQAPTLPLCLIAEVSSRGLSLLKSSYNENYVQLAYEAAVLGGADYLLPKNPLFFKNNNLNTEKSNVATIQNITATRNATLLNGMYAIESLSYEMYKKALVMLEQITKKGGLPAITKDFSLVREIKNKAQQEQAHFNKQCSSLPPIDLYSRKDWDFYPFSKKKSSEVLELKRLWEPFEKRLKQEDYDRNA